MFGDLSVLFSTDVDTDNRETQKVEYQSRYLQALINDRKQSKIVLPYGSKQIEHLEIETTIKTLKPQRLKRQTPQSRVSGGKANFDGDLGVYVPDYRPTDGSVLTSTYFNFSTDTLGLYPELEPYNKQGNYIFLRKLSDLYRYAGFTCPHIYTMVDGIESKIATIRMTDNSLLIRFRYGIPVPLITRVTNWVSNYVLEDIGTLYPIPGGSFMSYRASIDCLESTFLGVTTLDRGLVYAATDVNLKEDEPKPINLFEVLDTASKYATYTKLLSNVVTPKKVDSKQSIDARYDIKEPPGIGYGDSSNLFRFGSLYLLQNENHDVIVSRMQFKPRQFILDWLRTNPIAPNRSIDRDNNPVTGKKANRQYNRVQKSKRYGKGKVSRG